MFIRRIKDTAEFVIAQVPRYSTLGDDFIVDPIQEVIDHYEFFTGNDAVAWLVMHLDVFDLIDHCSVNQRRFTADRCTDARCCIVRIIENDRTDSDECDFVLEHCQITLRESSRDINLDGLQRHEGTFSGPFYCLMDASCVTDEFTRLNAHCEFSIKAGGNPPAI
ncbi:hypothetical protein D3C86_1655580 [compost metagenome]